MLAAAAGLVATGLLATGLLAGLLPGGDAARAAAAGVPTAGASAAGAHAATMTLAAQTPWVTGAAGTELRLRVTSALPDSRLGLNVVLYSRLGSRDAFVETLGGTEPTSEYPLDSPATIPLPAIRHGGLLELHLPVSTAYSVPSHPLDAPTLALKCGTGVCAGIYPLELVLLDRTDGAPLASLTTYLVYTPSEPGSLPLEVSLVLPLGLRPALTPKGAPLLDAHRMAKLAGLVGVLSKAPRDSLSLALHGQLLDGLARKGGAEAKGVLAGLAGLVTGTAPTDELLATPYGAPTVDGLATTGLGSELGAQLAADRQALAARLATSVPASPYVSPGRLDQAGLRLLDGAGVTTVVLPPSSLATPAAPVSTPTSPLLVADPGSPSPSTPSTAGQVPPGATEAVLADPGLAAAFERASGDPVLAAQQFLAQLASVYFDDPYATEPRGVVVVPRTTGSSRRFLAVVLAELASSPVLRPVTLGGLVDTVPVGANGAPTGATLYGAASASGAPIGAEVRAAQLALDTVRSVVPTDAHLLARLERSILLGEGAGLGPSRRAAYEQAPAQALQAIGGHLSLSGSRTTTLTSRSGRIPVTVQSNLAYPAHVVLRLHSNDLTFAANRSVLEIPLDLTGKASQSDVRVSTRTSGSTQLEISLLSPRNAYVLVDESVAVRSTAISGVAVALSAGAVLVLLAWWIRSSARRRRAARALGAAGAGPAATRP